MELRTLARIAAVALLCTAGAPDNGAIPSLARSFLDRGTRGSGWNINAPIPEPLGVAQGATLASADGTRLFHIGGITGDMVASNRLWIYSTAQDVWSRGADVPVSPGIRTYGAAVELDGFIYVFGGYDGTRVLDTTWVYDEAKDRWFRGSDMPGPRFGPAVAADAGVIWVMGGFENTSIGGVSDLVWRYDPSLDNWFLLGSVVRRGRLHAVTLPGGNIYVLVGGFDMDYHCSFNFRDLTSSCTPLIPFAVTDPAVVTDGVRIVVAGGESGPAPRPAGLTQVFDTVTRTWSMGPPMPSGIDNTSGAIANGTLYVVGGYDGETAVSVNYSLALSAAGAGGRVAEAAMTPKAPEAIEHLKTEIPQGEPSPWSINSPVPQAYGVAQGSTLASRDASLIYHVGGFGAYGSSRVRVYSPSDDARDSSLLRSPWWDGAPVPQERGIRSYGSAVELNGFLYLFGGQSGVAPSEAVLNTTWIYDEDNNSWRRGADMPGYRFGSAVASDGEGIWVMGGYNIAYGTEDTVWRYEPSTDSYLTGFAPMPRRLGRIHGVYLPDGTVHVLGGGELSSLTNHLVYDTTSDAWSTASPIPVGILDPATVTDGQFIYLIGAHPSPREPAITQIFNPAVDAWWQGPRVPTWPGYPDWGMDNTSGTIANGVLYVMGGYTGSTISFSYSAPLSELAASRW